MNFLVVDDNPDILNLVSSIIKMFGHGADEAKDGFEAIEQFQSNRYDVVITDAEMPKIDGSKLCRFLKSQASGVYIIGMSGSTSALKGLEDAGADVCLSKPFNLHTLEEAIASRFPSFLPHFDSLQPVA
jgi:DNA-binding response OmpR family regulator